MPRKINDEAIAKMKALTEAGATVRDIALQCGISVPSIYKLRREMGLKGKKVKSYFGDRFYRESVEQQIKEINQYYDNAIKHDVRVFEARFASGYRGVRL